MWWESRLFDLSNTGLFHGLELFFAERRQELSLRVVVSDTVSSDGEGKCCVQVLMDDHLASGHGGAPFGWLDLQDQIVKADDISPVHGSFELLREDQVQVPARAGQEGRALLRGRDSELAVELGHIVLGEKCVGRF